MGFSDNFTNVIEADPSSNKVNYIRHMLKYNDWYTSLDYLEETLSYLALQDWYDIDSAKLVNLLSATENGDVHAELICHISKQFRTSPLSTVYYCRYIIWEKRRSTEFAEGSNDLHSEVHLKISEFTTLDSYSACKMMSTGDTKLVDS